MAGNFHVISCFSLTCPLCGLCWDMSKIYSYSKQQSWDFTVTATDARSLVGIISLYINQLFLTERFKTHKAFFSKNEKPRTLKSKQCCQELFKYLPLRNSLATRNYL